MKSTVTFDWQLFGMTSKVYGRSPDYEDVTLKLDLGELGSVKIRMTEEQARSIADQIQIRLEGE